MKRHRTDGVSLAFGLIFLLIAIGWVVGRRLAFRLEDLGWAVALTLILVGGLGLLAALRRPTEPTDSAEPEPTGGPPADPLG